MKISETKDQLEKLMDVLTLPGLLQVAAQICEEKASHLRENWQDERAAKLWEKNAKQLSAVSGKFYS